TLEVRVDDERDDQAEEELERDGDHRELDRQDDRVPEDRVVNERVVVREADPLRRCETGQELLVREALVDGLAERIDRDEDDDGEGRQEQEPGEARLSALELGAPSTSAMRNRGWRSDRAHEW